MMVKWKVMWLTASGVKTQKLKKKKKKTHRLSVSVLERRTVSLSGVSHAPPASIHLTATLFSLIRQSWAS